MCLYPKLIKNRKYTINKKNNGNIPLVRDNRVLLVPVGCGNCIECRKQKARAWQVRLLEDIKTNRNGKFVTMTFSNKSIAELSSEIKGLSGYERDNAIATLAMRRFNERWRKKYKKAIRHWMVTEIGHKGTENIHLHGIVWTNEKFETISKIWQYGYMYPSEERNKRENYVNGRTISYIVKYVNKVDEKHKTYKSIILTSPGIGNNYTKTWDSKSNKYNGVNTIETYRTESGHKISMPIYWRNNIYSEEERENLWLNRMDKQEMWVMGEKVDVSKGYETYDKLQKYYRYINTSMGYGNNEKNEERMIYERERRNLMIKERLKDPYGTKKKKNEREKWIRDILGEGVYTKQKE